MSRTEGRSSNANEAPASGFMDTPLEVLVVHVRGRPDGIAVNPGSDTNTASGVAVPAASWMIRVTPLGG